MTKNNYKKLLLIGLFVLLSLPTMAGLVKSIFISLDIDESYAVAQAYRFVRGDRLLSEMWEPHQFSAFLAAIFIKPYLMITGTTDYLVIYLRIIGIILHILVGLILISALKKTNIHRFTLVLIMFVHLNFLPKWVQMPEFEIMHYWALLLIAACMIYYFYDSPRKVYPILSGVLLVLCMFSYPTMILLYPFYIAGWIVLEMQLHGKSIKATLLSPILLTAGSLISGLSFIAYLLTYQTPKELISNISNVFLDQSHTFYTMEEKWCSYGEQLAEQFSEYSIYFLAGLTISFILFLIFKFKKHERFNIESLVISAALIAASGLEIAYMHGILFLDENLFFLQFRFIALTVPALYLGIRYNKTQAIWLYSLLLPALISIPAVLLVTNMDTNVTYAKVFPGVIAALIIYAEYEKALKQTEGTQTPVRYANLLASSLLLIGLFICRLLLIRVTGCLPLTINARMDKMEYGAEKGVYVLEDVAKVWNHNYPILKTLVKEDDKLLYVGAENLVYLSIDCEIATPATQGTNVYNEMFVRYYESHHDKKPTVIVIDKTYDTNPVYGNYFGTAALTNWIEENYQGAERMETDYMVVINEN